jgi:uncharacterized protein with HEPN domain
MLSGGWGEKGIIAPVTVFMRGMRNRIAHGYYDINLDVVWETVATALPELVEKLGN